MTGPDIFRLVLQGLVFVVWAFMLFSVLFKLRTRAEKETGKPWPGPITALRQWGKWFRAPEDRRERNTLLFLTFVLLAMAATTALTAAA
jgi:heme/copper-type cytochrome/quinol oxidase subunit 3